MFKPKTTISGRLENSSGEWKSARKSIPSLIGIRTTENKKHPFECFSR